ncbi:hypothetical protein VNO78_15393 [Psophocarpus tetragonolobus]|uniref:Uncharacterized protein n=1 Tax=Psophocarpus tetragonolobus TaxID=3891 RepID=A0AAN9SEX4_PSOTE
MSAIPVGETISEMMAVHGFGNKIRERIKHHLKDRKKGGAGSGWNEEGENVGKRGCRGSRKRDARLGKCALTFQVLFI